MMTVYNTKESNIDFLSGFNPPNWAVTTPVWCCGDPVMADQILTMTWLVGFVYSAFTYIRSKVD